MMTTRPKTADEKGSPSALRAAATLNTPPTTPSPMKNNKNNKQVTSDALLMTPPPSAKQYVLPFRPSAALSRSRPTSIDVSSRKNIFTKAASRVNVAKVAKNQIKAHQSSKSSLSQGRAATQSMPETSTPSHGNPDPLAELRTPMASPSPAPRKAKEQARQTQKPRKTRHGTPRIKVVGNWRPQWLASIEKSQQSGLTKTSNAATRRTGFGKKEDKGSESDSREETDMNDHCETKDTSQITDIIDAKATGQTAAEKATKEAVQKVADEVAYLARRQDHIARLYHTGDPGLYISCADGPFLQYLARCHMGDLQHAAIRDYLKEHVMSASDYAGLMAWYEWELGEPERRAKRERKRQQVRDEWMRVALSDKSSCVLKAALSIVKVKEEDGEEEDVRMDDIADVRMENTDSFYDSAPEGPLSSDEEVLLPSAVKQEPEE